MTNSIQLQGWIQDPKGGCPIDKNVECPCVAESFTFKTNTFAPKWGDASAPPPPKFAPEYIRLHVRVQTSLMTELPVKFYREAKAVYVFIRSKFDK